MFKPTGPFVGNTLDEMMRKYKAQRDKEFAAHVCTETPQSHESKD